MRRQKQVNVETQMAMDRTQAIPGYRIQPLLPIGIPYLGIKVLRAEFRVYPSEIETVYVEAVAIIGTLRDAYTIVLSIDQAREADIIGTV